MTTPALSRRHWQVLGVAALTSLFSQYARSIAMLALPRIQTGLSIGDAELGYAGALIRLGAVPAFAVALAADRIGRRRALLGSTLALCLCTFATGFVQQAGSFVLLQAVVSLFATAQLMLAVVMIAEELEPEARGWGIGLVFMLQAGGVLLAATLFTAVNRIEGGWQGLYWLGLAPLLLLPRWRRTLPESPLFEAAARAPRAGLADVARSYGGRFAVVCAAVFLFAMGRFPADFLAPKFLQTVHGWRPVSLALLYFGGGLLALVGTTLAGRLSDRFGRRPLAVGLGVAGVVATLGFYAGSGPWLPVCWIAMTFTVTGRDVVLAAVGAELFPTSHRGIAGGAQSIALAAGGVAGLALLSVLYSPLGSVWTAVSVTLGASLLAPLVLGLGLPETARRPLEEVSPAVTPSDLPQRHGRRDPHRAQ